MYEIGVAVALYGVIVMLLVGLIMVAKKTLIPGGDLTIQVNQQRDLTTRPGGKLLGDVVRVQNPVKPRPALLSIWYTLVCVGVGVCGQDARLGHQYPVTTFCPMGSS